MHACMHTCIHKYIHTYIHTIPYHTIPFHSIPFHYITLQYSTVQYSTYLTLPCLTLPFLSLPYLTLPYLHVFVYIYIYTYVKCISNMWKPFQETYAPALGWKLRCLGANRKHVCCGLAVDWQGSISWEWLLKYKLDTSITRTIPASCTCIENRGRCSTMFLICPLTRFIEVQNMVRMDSFWYKWNLLDSARPVNTKVLLEFDMPRPTTPSYTLLQDTGVYQTQWLLFRSGYQSFDSCQHNSKKKWHRSVSIFFPPFQPHKRDIHAQISLYTNLGMICELTSDEWCIQIRLRSARRSCVSKSCLTFFWIWDGNRHLFGLEIPQICLAKPLVFVCTKACSLLRFLQLLWHLQLQSISIISAFGVLCSSCLFWFGV